MSTAAKQDQYSFTASTGESVIVRVGETVAASRLNPQVRIFSPNGTQIAAGQSTIGAEATVRATNSGIFRVSVRDNNGGANTGGYRLTFVKTGSPLVISDQY